MKIKIGEKFIGLNQPLYFIADIASNHDGNIKRAYKLIELAKEAGADAAKFQNFHSSTIVSDKGFQTMKGTFSHQKNWNKSIYKVYEESSVPDEWTIRLKQKCEEVGIEYMTSPYDHQAVDLVDPYVNAYKIGSGDITWIDIIEHIAKKGKPIILATGASEIVDVKRAVSSIYKINKQLVLMQCNTNYTGNDENFKSINLNVLKEYQKMYPDAVIGLSDHTKGYATILGAVALGATVFEKHFTDDNDRIGPDHKFSMKPKSWKEMVTQANHLYNALGDGKKKIEANEKETILIQRRALYYKKSLKKGDVIKAEDIVPLRPIHVKAYLPYEKDLIIGKKIKRDVDCDTCVFEGDV